MMIDDEPEGLRRGSLPNVTSSLSASLLLRVVGTSWSYFHDSCRRSSIVTRRGNWFSGHCSSSENSRMQTASERSFLFVSSSASRVPEQTGKYSAL